MIYALCIMYETMRLFPVLGTLPSMSTNDEMLLGKYFIPKNSSIGPDLVNLHRNEKYWGNQSDKFDPSRFDNRVPGSDNWHTIMDGRIKIPVKGAFLAFGDGPQACLGKPLFYKLMIGKRFAEVEFITCLTMVIQSWMICLRDDWTKQQVHDILDSSIRFSIMRPGSKIPLVFKRR